MASSLCAPLTQLGRSCDAAFLGSLTDVGVDTRTHFHTHTFTAAHERAKHAQSFHGLPAACRLDLLCSTVPTGLRVSPSGDEYRIIRGTDARVIAEYRIEVRQ